MKLEYISKSEFDFIKSHFIDFINQKLKKDTDTIFQFSSKLTPEDVRFIYQNSDNFIIEKSKIIEIDQFEKVNYDKETETKTDKKTETKTDKETFTNVNNDNKFEIIMRAGRKYHNKLQKYPITNMGAINVMSNKLDLHTKILTVLLGINSFMFFYVINK